MSTVKTVLCIFSLTIFLFLTRFYQLSIVPASLTHDETVYAIQALSYTLQGKTLDGSHRPWQLTPIHPMYAELPATLLIPGFLFTHQPLWATHFSSALMGVLIPFIFGWLLWGMWRKKDLALIGVLVVATSPLLWQFSRLSYDAFFSLFFYVLGGAIFVNATGKKKWWSLLLFGLGFFQYQGLKLLLVPWVGVLWLTALTTTQSFSSLSSFWQKRRSWLSTASVGVLFATIGLNFFYGLVLLPKQQTDRRLQRTIFTDTAIVAPQVNTERRLSLSSRLLPYASNKLTLLGQFMLNKLSGSFNLGMLFLHGEPSASGFAVWTQGIFYPLDAVLILIGIVVLLHRRRTRVGGVVLLGGTLLFIIPSLINTLSEWYLLRNILAYSTLLIFISWGFWWCWQWPRWRWLLLGVYAISVGYFGYQYWYRYPVTSLDAATFDERIIAAYSAKAQQQNPALSIIVHTDTPEMTFYNLLLYRRLLNADTITSIGETVRKNQAAQIKYYQLDKLIVTNDCVATQQPNTVAIAEIGHTYCTPTAELVSVITIPAVLDSGELFRIYGDTLCGQWPLATYVYADDRKKLTPEALDDASFCQAWITDLGPLRPPVSADE